jgi:3-dehydroquinate synthetase
VRAEVADLLARHGLPTELAADVDLDEVLAALARDKKRTAAGVPFVVLSEPGAPRTGEVIDADRVRQAVEELKQVP